MLTTIAISVGKTTSHHDQLITPTNFKTMNTIVNTVVIPNIFPPL